MDHVLVQEKSQQLAGKAAVPDNIVSLCQVDKHGTGLFFASKEPLIFCVSKTVCSMVDLSHQIQLAA